MAAGHGGARPGAGRPKGAKTRKASPADPATTRYADALSYLLAVACGTEPGDALRVAAAKAALPYQAPKARAPVASPAPAQLRQKVESRGEAAQSEAWASKVTAIRAGLKKKKEA